MSIDTLRGVAVLAVLLCHLPFSRELGGGMHAAGNVSVFPDWLVAVLTRGHAGVNLFLVISGFCIHARFARGERASFLAFWRRRMRRLYPPYFVALIGTIGLAIMARRMGIHVDVRPVDLVLLVLLLQNVNGAADRIGNGPFWTLALEEQLYLLYFPLLWMRRRFGWIATIAAVALVTEAWRTFGGPPQLGPARWIEWALGAVAVEAWLGVIVLPWWCRSLFIGVVALALALTTNSDGVYGIAFFILTNAAVAAESRGHLARALAFVGVWSYSLYLTHEPVLVAAKALGLRLHADVAEIAILRIVVPMLVAYAFHRLVERRFMHRRSIAGADRPTSLAPLS
ncbi:MAG TPA: acyltransferase [Polyangia bacterium]|jgi:peptidoglycan/LPS O-acetylase OafA/YrhL